MKSQPLQIKLCKAWLWSINFTKGLCLSRRSCNILFRMHMCYRRTKVDAEGCKRRSMNSSRKDNSKGKSSVAKCWINYCPQSLSWWWIHSQTIWFKSLTNQLQTPRLIKFSSTSGLNLLKFRITSTVQGLCKTYLNRSYLCKRIDPRLLVKA